MASAIHDIAERMGVSVSTVSRVLNGETSYNRPFYAERAERIRELARELGYRPNAAARAISTGRFGTIALLAAGGGLGGLPPHLVDGIGEQATALDLMVSFARLAPDGFTDPDKLPTILRQVAADGMLINYTHRWPEGLDEMVAAQGIPAVWLNVKRPRNCVRFADRQAACDTTRRLIAHGHRRIALVIEQERSPRPHYSAAERLAGYRKAMAEAGLEPELIDIPRDCADAVNAGPLPARLRAARRPTALLCNAAAEACLAAACAAGLRVPDELCLAAFVRMSHGLAHLPIAVLQIPQKELGSAGVAMLHRRLADPAHDEPAQQLPIPLHHEAFLRPPGGAGSRG